MVLIYILTAFKVLESHVFNYSNDVTGWSYHGQNNPYRKFGPGWEISQSDILSKQRHAPSLHWPPSGVGCSREEPRQYGVCVGTQPTVLLH